MYAAEDACIHALCNQRWVNEREDAFWRKSFRKGGQILARKNLPLRHDLERIGQITVDVLHLKGVSVADLVVCPAVIGTLDHDDITSWTA